MSIPGFDRCLAVTWQPDNDGQPFHTTRGDAGGATAWAVTFAIYAAWERAHGRPWPTVAQFRQATQADLSTILHAWFWLPVQGDVLPAGIDLMAFECCILSGQGTAVDLLQTVACVKVDGRLGPITLAAIAAMDPTAFVDSFAAVYEARLRDMHGAAEFDAGWSRRLLADAALARQWITPPATV